MWVNPISTLQITRWSADVEALCDKLATITGREDWSVTDEEIRGKKADDCFYRVGAGAYMGSATK